MGRDGHATSAEESAGELQNTASTENCGRRSAAECNGEKSGSHIPNLHLMLTGHAVNKKSLVKELFPDEAKS